MTHTQTQKKKAFLDRLLTRAFEKWDPGENSKKLSASCQCGLRSFRTSFFIDFRTSFVV